MRRGKSGQQDSLPPKNIKNVKKLGDKKAILLKAAFWSKEIMASWKEKDTDYKYSLRDLV